MSNRPSFQFYPGDWQANSNLRRCTHAEKGVWVDVMCLMHDQPEYGILRWPLKEIAQAIGCKPNDLKALQIKGVLKGDDKQLDEAFIYTPRSGRKDGDPVTLVPTQAGPIWYSSRMVRDEYVRTNRANQDGNGATPNRPPKPAPKPPIGEDIGVGFGPHDAITRTAPSSPSPSSPSGNTPPPATRAQAADNEVFPITAEWAPGPGFTAQAKLAGLPVLDPTAMAEGLNEFRGFWLARPHEIRTQAEWDNALAKSLKTRQVHAASRPKPSPGGRAGIQAKPPTAAELRVFRSSPQIMDPTARARCEAFTNAGHTAPDTTNVIDMEAPNGLAIGLD